MSTHTTIVPAAIELPILDLSEPDIIKLGEQFRYAGEKTGFMQIINHGVPKDLIKRIFGQNETLFKLPMEEKMKLERDPVSSRGYLVFGAQKLQGSLGSGHEGGHAVKEGKIGDQKEGYTFGLDHPSTHKNAGRMGHGLNRLPPEELVPGFKEVAEEYLQAMLLLQGKMTDIVSASLNTDLTGYYTDAVIHFRMLHYPASEEPDVVGVGAHTDFGFTTLLATSGEPGLQVWYRDQWHPVEPEEGAYIVNIGDALARVSGGRFKSSLHRVITNTGPTDRYSIPCFLEGNLDFVVKPVGEPDGDYPILEDVYKARQRETFTSNYSNQPKVE